MGVQSGSILKKQEFTCFNARRTDMIYGSVRKMGSDMMYTDTAYTLRQYDDEPMDLEGNGGNELAEAFHQGCIDAWLRAGLRLRRPSFADFFGKFRRDDDDDDTYFMIAY